MTDNITRDILIRVSFIHKMRKLREPFMYVALVSMCAFVASVFFVSFESVFHNSPAVLESTSFVRFVAMAFWNTELFVQAAVVVLSITSARYVFLIVKSVAKMGFSLLRFKKVETALS